MKFLTTKDEFDSSIKDGKVAIDFTASWCGPCKMIGPKFEKMAEEFSGISFFKVDVDENEDAAASAGVSAMPTFKFYNNGVQVGDLVGASEDKLRDELKKLAAL